MRVSRFSLNHLVLLVIGGLGLIPLVLLLLAFAAATDIATDTASGSLTRVVGVATREVMRDLELRAREEAYTLAARADLRAALAERNLPRLAAVLDDPLEKGFAGARLLELVKLRVYDADHRPVSESRLGPDALPSGPPPAVDGAETDPLQRFRAASGLWQTRDHVFYSVMVPIGGLRPSGYLELVLDPLFNLTRVGTMVQLPLRIERPDGDVRFASADDGGRIGTHTIVHRLEDGTGETAYHLLVQEDLSAMHTRFGNHRLAVGATLLAAVAMVLGGAWWALQRFVVRPIKALSHQLAGCDELTLCSPAEPRCLREIDALSRALCSMTDKVREHTRNLEQLTTTDPLTGIANRRRFDDALHHEWDRAQRSSAPLSLLLVDVDHFKPYNDTLGHLAGDACLRRVAETLEGLARRPSDLVARYGGEEFAILLPETPPEGAREVAARAVESVRQLLLNHPASPIDEVVTVSVGCATLVPAPQLTPHRLVAQADEMLYRAKEGGRNRFLPAQPEAIPEPGGQRESS